MLPTPEQCVEPAWLPRVLAAARPHRGGDDHRAAISVGERARRRRDYRVVRLPAGACQDLSIVYYTQHDRETSGPAGGASDRAKGAITPDAETRCARR